MQSQVERIRELKTEAKNRRDRGLRGYERAVRMLKEAIGIAEAGLEESALAEHTQLATEITDCYGLIGGIERRWASDTVGAERDEHLLQSIAAYDRGFEQESDARYGIANSYNRLNRLLSRLLLKPMSLEGGVTNFGPEVTALDVNKELVATAELIREQLIGTRRGDFWAMADLALIHVVLGHADPAAAYAEFNAMSPPDFAYKSALAGLQPLAEVPLKTAGSIKKAIGALESRLGRLGE